MDGLETVRAEYDRLDRMLGIDTSGILLSCSARMVRQYGVCCFCGDRPAEIRLAAFLLDEPEQLHKTALHEYAHAAAALLTGRRHGHVAVWKAICLRIGCAPERLSEPCEAARRRAEEYEKDRAGAPVWLVVCRGCGAVSRYRRRGKVVQLLQQHPTTSACVCRQCGGRSFALCRQKEGI